MFSDYLNKSVTPDDTFCNKCRLIPYIIEEVTNYKCTASDKVSLGMETGDEASATTGVSEETWINSEDSDTSSNSDIIYE